MSPLWVDLYMTYRLHASCRNACKGEKKKKRRALKLGGFRKLEQGNFLPWCCLFSNLLFCRVTRCSRGEAAAEGFCYGGSAPAGAEPKPSAALPAGKPSHTFVTLLASGSILIRIKQR